MSDLFDRYGIQLEEPPKQKPKDLFDRYNISIEEPVFDERTGQVTSQFPPGGNALGPGGEALPITPSLRSTTPIGETRPPAPTQQIPPTVPTPSATVASPLISEPETSGAVSVLPAPPPPVTHEGPFNTWDVAWDVLTHPNRIMPFDPIQTQEQFELKEAKENVNRHLPEERRMIPKYPPPRPWQIPPGAAPPPYTYLPEQNPLIPASYARDYARVLEEQERQKELQRRGTTMGYGTADILANMIPYALEFAATRPVERAVAKGIVSGAGKLVPKVAKSKVGGFGIKAGAHLVGTAAQTAAMPNRIITNALENMSPDIVIEPGDKHELRKIILDPGDNFGEAMLRAFGENWVEVASEYSGGIFDAIGQTPAMKAMKATLIGRWLRRHPGGSVRDFLRTVRTSTGWHGVIGEEFEELVARGAQPLMQRGISALTGTSDPEAEQFRDIRMRDIMTELIAFSIPGMGAKVLTTADEARIARELSLKTGRSFSEVRTTLRRMRQAFRDHQERKGQEGAQVDPMRRKRDALLAALEQAPELKKRIADRVAAGESPASLANELLVPEDVIQAVVGQEWVEPVGSETDQEPDTISILPKALNESLDIDLKRDLSPDESKVQDEFYFFIQNYRKLVDQVYDAIPDSHGGKVVGTDIARQIYPKYKTPEERWQNTQATSRVASAYATDRLRRELLDPPVKEGNKKPQVLFNAGGVASGKSRSINEEALRKFDLISDGQMRDPEKAIKEINLALQKGWQVRVDYTHRPFHLVVHGAIGRAFHEGRWGPASELPDIHMQAQRSILAVAKHFKNNPNVDIKIQGNFGTNDIPKDREIISIKDIDIGGKYHYPTIGPLREVLNDVIRSYGESGRLKDVDLERFNSIIGRGTGRGKDSREIGYRGEHPEIPGGDEAPGGTSDREGDRGREIVLPPGGDRTTGISPPALGGERGLEDSRRKDTGGGLRGYGKEGKLILANKKQLPFRYALMEAEDLITSHDPTRGFQPDPLGDPNERPYHDARNPEGRAGRELVETIASKPNSRLIHSDTPSPVDGPPVVEPSGRVPGGNARAMGQKLAYHRGGPEAEKLREKTISNAIGKFGINQEEAEAFKHPVLVRLLNEGKAPGELSRILNEGLTTGRSQQTDAVSRGKLVKPRTISFIATHLAEGDVTLSQILNNPKDGRLLLEMLQEDGVLTGNEVIRYWDVTSGKLNENGRNAIEDLLVGRVIPDVSSLTRATPAIKNKITKALGALTQIQGSLENDLVDALDVIETYFSQKAKSIEEVVLQPSFLGDTEDWRRNPRALALARSLVKDKPVEFKRKIQAYADAYSNQDQNMMFEIHPAGNDPNAVFEYEFKQSDFEKIIKASIRESEVELTTSGISIPAYKKVLERMLGKDLLGYTVEFVSERDINALWLGSTGKEISTGQILGAFVDGKNKHIVVNLQGYFPSAAHEAGHVLFNIHRALKAADKPGLFTPAEMNLLEKEFGTLANSIDGYQGKEQRQNEERMMNALMSLLEQDKLPRSPLARIAYRIFRFIQRIAQAMGIKPLSRNELMRNMLSGEIGRRAEGRLAELEEAETPRGWMPVDMTKENNAQLQPFVAFHGTPHVFAPEPGFPHGRFRLDKIGTGEGAQAYGWGIYFSEDPAVAQSYAETLGKSKPIEIKVGTIDVKKFINENPSIPDFSESRIDLGEMVGYIKTLANSIKERDSGDWRYLEGNDQLLLDALKRNLGYYVRELRHMARDYESRRDDAYRTLADLMERVAEEATLDNITYSETGPTGQIYHLDIPDDVTDKMLDWDKPLVEQATSIQTVLGQIIPQVRKSFPGLRDDSTGGDIYYAYSGHRGYNQQAVSEYLAERGIPGMKYLDQQSREDQYEVSRIWENENHPDRVQWRVSSRSSTYLKHFFTEAEALADAAERNKEKTYNYVIWDQAALDRIVLLKRNEERLDTILAETEEPLKPSILKRQKAELVLPPGVEAKSHIPEVETALEGARGLKREGWIKRAWRWQQQARRHIPELHTTKSPVHAATSDLLRQAEAASEFGLMMAEWQIYQITKDMSPETYRIFSRHLVLQDLQRSVEEGLYEESDLPFYSKTIKDQAGQKAALLADLDRFQKIVDANPGIQEALKRREEIVFTITDELVRLKLLSEDVLDDPRYFHRQIHQYMDTVLYHGGGGPDIRIRKKGFERRRQGSAKDYNTEYIESEIEWMTQAYVQIARSEVIHNLEALLDIKDSIQAIAKEENLARAHGGWEIYDRVNRLRGQLAELNSLDIKDSAIREQMAAIHEQLDPIDVLAPYRQRMAISLSQLSRLRLEELDIPDKLKPILTYLRGTDLDKEQNPAAGDSLMPFLSWLAGQQPNGTETHGKAIASALGFYKALSDQKKFIREKAGKKFVDWQDLIPADYETWQPKEGSVIFKAKTVTEKVMEKLITGQVAATPELFKDALVVGGPREQWVIPSDIKAALDNFKASSMPDAQNRVAQVNQQIMTGWKKWQLLNPWRFIRYNLNNLSGDLDIAIAYDARMLKYSPAAAKDLWKFHFQGKGKQAVIDEIQELIRLGVLGSTLSTAEIPDIRRSSFLLHVSGQKENMLKRLSSGYWGNVQTFTVWRENILRLAAYRYFNDQLKKGRKNIYGASKRLEIDAITDRKEKASKLARELIGDYGDISHAGQWIRRQLAPFYSWIEINTVRYHHLLSNVAYEGRGSLERAVSGKIAKASINTPLLAVRAFFLFAMTQLWNRLFFPDEDKILKQTYKEPFLILPGRTPSGGIRYLRFAGALSDFLEWFDLQDWPEDVRKLASGDKDMLDMLAEAPKAIIDRFVQSSHPGWKTLFEAGLGRSAYPTLFHEGKSFERRATETRSRLQVGLSTWSLGTPYKWARGIPTREKRPLGILADLATYEADPGEVAYRAIREKVYQWKRAQGKATGGAGRSERSEALYFYRQALMYGDDEKARKYLRQYFELGGTDKGLERSIDMSAPLGSIAEKDKDIFIGQLNKDDKELLRMATAWHLKHFK